MRRLAALLCLALLLATRPAAAAPEGERYLAIYLPGVYFAQLERKLELGNELASHLAEKLGPGYQLTPRVYATSDAMDAEAGRIVLGLLESPLVAARLSSLLPIAAAVAAGTTETRQVLLAVPSIRSLAGLRGTRLVHAESLEKPQAFFDNFVFEGELSLGSEHLAATRDVASALSMASLHKADALMVYEDDEAMVQNIGLRTLYRTGILPRPTLVSFDRRLPVAEVQRLREAMGQFHGSAHPTMRAYRSTTEGPYHSLRARIEQKPRRLPALVDLVDDETLLPLPHPPASSSTQVPVTTYAPPLQ